MSRTTIAFGDAIGCRDRPSNAPAERRRFFHSRPALPRRFFGRACAAPVGFEADSVVIAVALQRGELTFPIDDAGSDGRPVVAFAVGFARDVFAVAMSDALFRQQLVSVGIRRFAGGAGVSRIPIHHEVRRGNSGENFGGFRAGSGIARHLVFKHEDDFVFRGGCSGFVQLGVDGVAIWLLIVEAPEVEEAHAIGLRMLSPARCCAPALPAAART